VIDETTKIETAPSVTPSGQLSLVGMTLVGRYLITKELGRGGIGAAYLAHDKRLLSKPVVIKVLLEESLQNEWVVNKFRQEIEALSLLDDPGIVGITDAGDLPDGKPFLVMQYVDGVTLTSLIVSEGMSLSQTGRIVQQVGRALSAAHEKGIIHRDLKPDNIMLRKAETGEEQVKIIDFGIAKVTNSVVAPSTSSGRTAGTLAYMSPEQLLAKTVTPESDTYALAAISYELLTGRRPFNPDSIFELLEMHREGVRVNPQDLRPSLPAAAQAAIMRSLSFDPSLRHRRSRDFGNDLAIALASDVGFHAVPTKKYKPHGKRSVKGAQVILIAIPFAIVALLGVVLVAAIIGSWLWSTRVRQDPLAKSADTSDGRSTAAPARTLAYFLEVQKYRNGKPYEKSFTLPGEINFEKDYRVRMFFSGPQQGHLYLLNEGPSQGRDLPEYVVLFPDAKGSSLLESNQRVEIPPHSEESIRFDSEIGTEKVWMVWSAGPIDKLEQAKKLVNPKDRGVIKTAETASAVRDYLMKFSSSHPEVKKDEDAMRTTVTTNGDVLVYSLKLQHH
jgi:tRNA A-37 threonylcarbamoyl transferase component Bud32